MQLNKNIYKHSGRAIKIYINNGRAGRRHLTDLSGCCCLATDVEVWKVGRTLLEWNLGKRGKRGS
jgi:hypothetical protein